MNATSIEELRSGLAAREGSDETMDQVRELLFGDASRRLEVRIAAMEVRQRETERMLGQRLDALAARVEALGGEVGAERRSGFEALARSVSELGDEIRRISRQ